MYKKPLKIAAAVIALLAMMAGTAVATHVFNDVPDGAFYAVPAEWAADNGITQGCGNNNFCPDRNITRGETITFDYRYDQNIVQPTISTIAYQESGTINDWSGAPESLTVNLVAPGDGFALITYVANAGRDHTSSPTSGVRTLGTGTLAGAGFAEVSYVTWENETAGGGLESIAVLTMTKVRPVSAGSNSFTGSLAADENSYFYGHTLTAEFIPNGAMSPGFAAVSPGAGAFGAGEGESSQN